MLKRLAIALTVMLALMVGLDSRHRTVLSNALTDNDVMVLSETTDAETQELQELETKKDGGNRLVKVVKFPFKAVARLFGGGKKNENKLERISKKDAKKFESTGVTRIEDARTPPATETAANTTDSTNVDSLDAAEVKKAQALEHLQRGRELFNAKDINGAINSLSMATSLDRQLWDAHNLLGIAYEIKGLRAKALESLYTALKGDNDKPEHLNDFGYILMNNGEYSRAVKFLKRAVKAQPHEQRFLNNLGMALVQIGKFDEAYKHFEKAMGEFDGRMNIATRLVRLGYDKEAIKHLERCRAIQPNNLEVLYPLTVLYGRAGRTTEAEETNKHLLTLKTTATTTSQQ
jgi:Flp pilus assembly protein TadD